MKVLDAIETGAHRVSSIRVTQANERARQLWEERCKVCIELDRLGAERRRLTESLPWWAATGRRQIDSDGR